MKLDKTWLQLGFDLCTCFRDRMVVILISFWQLWYVSKLILTCQGGIWTNRPKQCTNDVMQTWVTGHVHGLVTSCSSKLLRWGWSLLKSDVTPFNFDVYCWSWFMLEVSEKSPYIWLSTQILQGSFFTKCLKSNCVFLDFAQFIT